MNSSAFGEGHETLALVTELTAGKYSASFISHYGSEDYFTHNMELMFYTRRKELIAELQEMDL